VTPELFAASARPPTLIGAVAVPTFLRRETRWTGPVPKSFASVHGKPPLQFEGEPVWAEFIVLRLLARAGWQGVWVKIGKAKRSGATSWTRSNCRRTKPHSSPGLHRTAAT